MQKLQIYNTLSGKKEQFEPLNPPFVGLYVCGPTVYGDAHLGHSRPAVTFDVVFRYLQHIGHKVRYVRNITDVGHLANDSDDGEDKIAKKARLEQLEPMEVVQHYTKRYHRNMDALNVLPPSIEPTASGHIPEQIEMIKQILKSGFAYRKNRSVYFDVEKYNKENHYGKLSGRVLEDLLSSTRELDGQKGKKNSFDFALWKKADSSHIMRWKSPWGDGFPGWHLECSAMSTKYLGKQFDIHGGGMDLMFPHHECEIAQSKAANGIDSVKYWMHNNMITINGQKMGKSLDNFITLDDLFAGNNDLLEQAYSPMVIRFFVLQAHYRSTLDFSNDALKASEKGLNRLMTVFERLDTVVPTENSEVDAAEIEAKWLSAMNDDFNTPILISYLFDGMKIINSLVAGTTSISANALEKLKTMYKTYIFDILGLLPTKKNTETDNSAFHSAIDLLLSLRTDAKNNKDWATADKIRDELTKLGFEVKDTKEGFEWLLKK